MRDVRAVELQPHAANAPAHPPHDGSSRPCLAPADVEEITQKTGSFKKFGVFVEMVRTAFGAPQSGDESLKLDVLTYADLQVLKQRKAGGGEASAAAAPTSSSTKRYLILTYASQFDRVHFPLPLTFIDAVPQRPAELPPPPQRAEPLHAASARVQWSAPRAPGAPGFGYVAP